MDRLDPPTDLPAGAREIVRLWSVKGNPRQVRQVSRFDGWKPEHVGEALSAVAAGFLHAREIQHRDPLRLQGEDDNLRVGFSNGLSSAHVRHDPRRYDEWGSPFKNRFMELGSAAGSVLAKDFPELFDRVADDETAIVYYPNVRQLGIPVLDGGPSVIVITHDPFSGRPLPRPLNKEWFAAVENLLGHPHSIGDPVPDEFRSEAWWIARGL